MNQIATPHIDIARVFSVYAGKAGVCCCGCAGKHTYASAHREYATKNRGYEVDADEINERVVAVIVNKINAAPAADLEVEYGLPPKPSNISLTLDGRIYIAYLVPHKPIHE